ncbi:MAG TPA: serine protease [Roseateles sp.]
MSRTVTALGVLAVAVAPLQALAQVQAKETNPPAESVKRSRDLVIQQKLQDASRRLKSIDDAALTAAESSSSLKASNLLRQRASVAAELNSWIDAKTRLTIESICGPKDDSVDVERYKGTSPPKNFVDDHEKPVAQIQWHSNLLQRLGSGGDPGNVEDQRWCTGTMIDERHLLTAGHCFDIDGNGWTTPRKNGTPLSPAEMAPLMKLNFRYQRPPTGSSIRTAIAYPIVSLVEHRLGGLDYAIVETGKGDDGNYPSKLFGTTNVSSSAEVLKAASLLTVIQHPDGNPKMVATGKQHSVALPYLQYSDVDTRGGASGAGVLEQGGNLIAVHVLGGCKASGGSNSGVTASSIRAFSPTIQALP